MTMASNGDDRIRDNLDSFETRGSFHEKEVFVELDF